ncbi:hypothetical protein PS2_032964 [Malus domestica]
MKVNILRILLTVFMLFCSFFQTTPVYIPFATSSCGMLLLHGHGMHRTKHVGFVGWHLMVVVPIVNSLGMIAR